MAKDSKSLVPQNYQPGSQPLRDRVKERYCRYRAQQLPRIEAYRKAHAFAWRGGYKLKCTADSAYDGAYKYERNDQVSSRINYLANHGSEELIVAKRNRIEERLWSIHESDIGDYFEVSESGKIKPKAITDLPPEIRKNIEKLAPDSQGNWVPQLYSKAVASKELRAFHAFGRSSDASDVSRLSDADLVAQLSDTAKELGVEIDLNFRFAQQPQDQAPDTETDDPSAQAIDIIEDDTTKR